jgi:cyclopropane fatty-acyl-phospholipid synthase-like methyltransferase
VTAGDGLGTSAADYLEILRVAFEKHYGEGSDVWTHDQEMRAFPAIIQGRLKLPGSTRALDIGCGSGRDVAYFSNLYDRVVGVDLYPHHDWGAIGEQHPNAAFAAVDLLRHRWDERYDLVLDNGCFHHQHPDHYRDYLGRVARMIRGDGSYVLSTFKNPDLSHRIDAYGRLHRYFTDSELHRHLRSSGLEPFDELDVWRERCADFYRLTYCRRA